MNYYYKIDDNIKNGITEAFNDGDLDEIFLWVETTSIMATGHAWKQAEEKLKRVGYNHFFNNCANCKNKGTCDSHQALDDCGYDYELWEKEDSK